MGTSTINTTQSIYYDGSWLSYPIITATGSITNLTITNTTTGLTIAMSGNIPAPCVDI
jgi:phage-related protein